MYTYNFTKTDEVCAIFKKARKKFFARPTLGAGIGLNIIIYVLIWYTLCNLNNVSLTIYFLIITMYILLQLLLYNIYSNKMSNMELKETEEEKTIIHINENGIKYCKKNYEKDITWDGIEKINIYKDYIFIKYNLLIPSNIIIFKCLDVEKDIIVSEIEKYKKVRWC